MNTGHWWTKEEDDSLRREWTSSDLGITEFSARYAGNVGLSAGAVQNRVRRLKLTRENSDMNGEGASYEQGEDFINIICASKRMLTKDDVIQQFKIDTEIWMVDKFKVKTSEGYRKDRKVKWKVSNGVVLEGDVDDTGKMLVVPLFHIEVRLVRKTEEIRARNVIHELIADAKACSPRYPMLKHKPSRDGMLYEIGMPDLHFGRLTWEEETGEDYDIKIARAMVMDVLAQLIAYAGKFKVDKILLPIGNDFF